MYVFFTKFISKNKLVVPVEIRICFHRYPTVVGHLWFLLANNPENEFMIPGNVICGNIQGKCVGFSVRRDNDIATVFFRSPASENEANDER